MSSSQRILEYMLKNNSIIHIMANNGKNIKITEDYETIETQHRRAGCLISK